ncbi:MAG: flagellar assembly protein FliH [Rhodoferax sp.]|nr:flagellar assembly protein FliH [Rhodoferax sp.]
MSRAQTKFISGEDIARVTEYDFDPVDQTALRFAAKLRAQELAEEQTKAEQIRQAGFSEGYAQGFAQGNAKGTLEGQRQINDYVAKQGREAATRFGQLFATVQSQIAQAEQAMAQGVLELACELARQVLRHEMATNPNALQPVIREALGLLAMDSKAALIRLNPMDLDILAEVLRQEFSYLSLTLVADAAVSRGGCLVEAAGTVVDGTLERRWARAVASLGLESSWEVADGAQ